MFKLFSAFVMVLGLSASAYAETAKCEGVVVSPVEAKDFNKNYGILILVAGQSKPPHELVPEEKQVRVVEVLKKLDAAATAKEMVCVEASAADVDLVLEVGDTLTKEIQRAGNTPLLVDLTMRVNGGNRNKALEMIDHFVVVAKRMMDYVSKMKTL